MHELTLSSVTVDPGSFTLSPGDPMYFTEYCSWQIHKILYNLGVQGFTFQQAEDDDYNTVEEQMDTYAESIATWIPSAVNASAAGEEIPPAPSLPDWVSGGRSPTIVVELLVLAVKILIYVGCKWMEKKLDPATTAAEESAVEIKRVHDLMEHVFTKPEAT